MKKKKKDKTKKTDKTKQQLPKKKTRILSVFKNMRFSSRLKFPLTLRLFMLSSCNVCADVI